MKNVISKYIISTIFIMGITAFYGQTILEQQAKIENHEAKIEALTKRIEQVLNSPAASPKHDIYDGLLKKRRDINHFLMVN